MQISLKIIFFLCAIFFLLVFIYLVRRKSLKPTYSFLWFLISILMLCVIIFERFFKRIADFLNVPDTSFLIIVGVIFFLLLYVLYLSIKLSEVSDKIQELISHVAILHKSKQDK